MSVLVFVATKPIRFLKPYRFEGTKNSIFGGKTNRFLKN
jgi:hypothetical protein